MRGRTFLKRLFAGAAGKKIIVYSLPQGRKTLFNACLFLEETNNCLMPAAAWA
jgi:hypothetical protein